MFRPNATGQIAKKSGYDKFGRKVAEDFVDCPYAPVNMKLNSQKTSVRADSSASRGQSDELTSAARILLPIYIRPAIGDLFSADGINYEIISVHPRRSIAGLMDHFECDLGVLP
jgi:hypothetical protein